MPAVFRPIDFRAANGGRPMLQVPSAQWCAGPFSLSAEIANGAATSVNLATPDVWFGDAQVRQAYALTNGVATSNIKATLWLEAVMLQFPTGAFAALAAATKDNLLADTTAPYIEANVGGTVRKIGLVGHMEQLVRILASALAAGAQAEVAELMAGRPYVLPSPISIDLENDTFYLKSDADVALGAATPVVLRLQGQLYPSTAGLPGMLPGGACGIQVPDAQEVGPAFIAEFRKSTQQAIALARPLF